MDNRIFLTGEDVRLISAGSGDSYGVKWIDEVWR